MLRKKHIKHQTNWYLLQTKYKQEKRALLELQRQNIDAYMPILKKEKIKNNKKICIEEPLFSRYLFVFLDTMITNWTSLRSTRGVSNFVEFGSGPHIVCKFIVEEMKKNDDLPPSPFMSEGDQVTISSGSFKDIDAIYKAPDGESRSYILLDFMQQEHLLKVKNSVLKKIIT